MTDSVAAPAEDYSSEEDFLGHPKGLYVCFTTELWERFSFYGMKYLLLLYLTKYHLFTDEMGLDVLGSYAGLVYALPLVIAIPLLLVLDGGPVGLKYGVGLVLLGARTCAGS